MRFLLVLLLGFALQFSTTSAGIASDTAPSPTAELLAQHSGDELEVQIMGTQNAETIRYGNYLAMAQTDTVATDGADQELQDLVEEAKDAWEEKPEKGDPFTKWAGWAVGLGMILWRLIVYIRKRYLSTE